MYVAVLANLKKNAPKWPGMRPDQWDELDSDETVNGLIEALEAGGHDAFFLEGDVTLYDTLRKYRPDICFNICEGHFGDAREAQVPAILEMLRIPYTGSKVLALALMLDKPMTKRVLRYHGLPTPEFQVFEREDEPLDPSTKFPLFVKPSREGTGMGVTVESTVHDEGQLRAQLRRIFEQYHQPALVERFIRGREVTVGVVGNLITPVARRVPDDEDALRVSEGLHFFPPLEVDLNAYPDDEGDVYTSRMKVELASYYHCYCPAPLRPEQVQELNWLTAATFRVTGCLDVARVDFRLEEGNGEQPYILEINPLPGIRRDWSDLCTQAAADGWTYEQLINYILDQAIARYRLKDPLAASYPLAEPAFSQ